MEAEIVKGEKETSGMTKACLFMVPIALIVILAVVGGFGIGFYFFEVYSKPETMQDDSIEKQPNIVYILLDDLGFNDVSWNNPNVITPHLENLARNGIILDQNYMQPACSPSRGSLMTGLYSHHIGMNHGAILSTSPECARLGVPFLPEKLRDYGYATHMVGKWHLGFCNLECTPTYRGFDTYYGFYQNRGDHYTHEVDGGFDWHSNTDIDNSTIGIHSTELITDRAIEHLENHDPETPMFLYMAYGAPHTPLQAPAEFIQLYMDESNLWRRLYLAMVTHVDQEIGRFVEALRKNGLMENTVIMFSSDNGGQAFIGSNAPLRGSKNSLYEGGTRVPGFVYGRGVAPDGEVNNGLIHAADWFPTILSLAGGYPQDFNLDGIDQTDMLFNDGLSRRDEIIYNIDTIEPQIFGAYSIRVDDYKLILGYPGLYDGWEHEGTLGLSHEIDIINGSDYTSGPSQKAGGVDYSAVQDYVDYLGDSPQLFNIRADPAEKRNLADELPHIVDKLRGRIAEHAAIVYPVHPEDQLPDEDGDPSNFGGNWSPGWC